LLEVPPEGFALCPCRPVPGHDRDQRAPNRDAYQDGQDVSHADLRTTPPAFSQTRRLTFGETAAKVALDADDRGSSVTTWTRIDFGPNVKLHGVPGELRDALLVDMAARGHAPTATFDQPGWQIEKPCTEWHFDLGGGIFIDEPDAEIVVEGLTMSCWAEQIESVIQNCIKFAPARAFANGQAYHKIHTWPMHALVVTPTQYSMIVDGLVVATPTAIARWTAFEATRKAVAVIQNWEGRSRGKA
jgi:hypothetical protein